MLQFLVDPDFRKQWLAALRGESAKQYKQGVGKLRTLHDKFCCLGVACDLKGLPWERSRTLLGPDAYGVRISPLFVDCNYPPTDIETQLGGKNVCCHLAQMNDRGKSFAEIADWIEANVPVVSQENPTEDRQDDQNV